jgi:hypothetical protein
VRARHWARTGHTGSLAAYAVGWWLLVAPVIAPAAGDVGVSSRMDFRPLGRADEMSTAPHRAAPSQLQSRRAAAANWGARLPDITSARTGTRKAVPITRGQELGLRFRPDERDPLQGRVPPSAPVPGALGAPADSPAFRPLERRARPTYEALENERRATESRPAPPLAYPGLVPPPTLPPPRGAMPIW